MDHSDGFAASDAGLTSEFVCEAACAAGFREPQKARTDDASLHVVTFSLEDAQIGPDHALVLCAFLLRDVEWRHDFRSSLVSLASGFHSESLKRGDDEAETACLARTKTARIARAAAVAVCASAVLKCHEPVAEVCLMLEDRVRAGNVTSSPRPFHAADLSGDAALRDEAALAWLRKFIAEMPLRTAEKTLSYLKDGVAARLAAAEYVGGKHVFAPFDGPPDKEGLENALVNYGVIPEKAELIAAQTCEAVLRKPPPCQQTIPSAFAFGSASVAEPTAGAPPPVRPPPRAPPPRQSTASSPPPPRPPKPSSSSKPAKGRMDAFLREGMTKPASAPPRPKKRPEPQRRLDSYFGGGGSQKKARRSATSDDVANESDAGPWACSKCTYLHEKADERGFLACKMCGAPKPNAPMPDGA